MKSKHNKNKMTGGAAIKDLRNKMGMTQVELGRLIGVSDSEICQYEKNNRTPRPPIALALTKLARKIGIKISLEYIYED